MMKPSINNLKLKLNFYSNFLVLHQYSINIFQWFCNLIINIYIINVNTGYNCLFHKQILNLIIIIIIEM